MAQIAVSLTHVRSCAGCLGNGNCWVCLGTGRLLSSESNRVRCHRCRGTGLCAEELHGGIAVPVQA